LFPANSGAASTLILRSDFLFTCAVPPVVFWAVPVALAWFFGDVLEGPSVIFTSMSLLLRKVHQIVNAKVSKHKKKKHNASILADPFPNNPMIKSAVDILSDIDTYLDIFMLFKI
jgi:hypothetical protein